VNTSPIDAVTAQAASRDLCVERLAGARKNTLDPRLLYVEKKPCQVIRTAHDNTSPAYFYAKSLRLYLPRPNFADFLIYVVMDSVPPSVYIIPRGVLSQDTYRTLKSLEEYRNAWGFLATSGSPQLTERRFTSISPQLQYAMGAAQCAGLEVELIRTERGKRRSDYRSFFQRRLLIAGRKCAVYSASKINKELDLNEHSVVVLRAPTDSWAEFQLYLVEDGAVYVIPRGSIAVTTTLSLSSLGLRPYRNAWGQLRGDSIRPELY